MNSFSDNVKGDKIIGGKKQLVPSLMSLWLVCVETDRPVCPPRATRRNILQLQTTSGSFRCLIAQEEQTVQGWVLIQGSNHLFLTFNSCSHDH